MQNIQIFIKIVLPKVSVGYNQTGVNVPYPNKIEIFLGHNKKFIDFDDKSKAIGFAKYPNFFKIDLPKSSVG